jgi:hypothetical protein
MSTSASKKPQKPIEIELSKFNMRWIGNNKILVLIGARTRGKSTILLDYLSYNTDIPFVTCISPTDCFNNTFSPHIPARFIFSKYSPELLKGFLMRQSNLKNAKEQAKLGYGDRRYRDVDCRGILIMDDCLADSKGPDGWKNDDSIRWIFMNGRHVESTLVLTMQYQVGIPPELRINIDWIFLCRETKKIEKEKLWKYYAGAFPSFDMFNQIFNRCTKDKRCMVIDGLSESEKIEDQIFWYKADIHGPFRLCYDEFWENNEHYLRQRIKTAGPNGMGSAGAAKAQGGEDDYYKYVGGTKGKPVFNLNMSEGGDEEDED